MSPGPDDGGGAKAALKVLAKVLVTVACLWWLARSVDLGAAAAQLAQLSLGHLAAALVLLTLQIPTLSGSWLACLAAQAPAQAPAQASRRGSPSFGWGLRAAAISLLANNLVPAGAGGFATRVLLAERAGFPLAAAFSATLAERLFHIWALASIVLVAVPAAAAAVTGGFEPLLSVALGVAAAVFAGIAVLFLLARMDGAAVGAGAATGIGRLQSAVRGLGMDGYHVRAAAWTLAWHGLALAAAVVLARGAGIGLPPIAVALLAAPVLLMASLPVSVAGWGVREIAMVAVLGLVAVPAERALTLSVALGAATLATRLPALVIWLLLPEGRFLPPHPGGKTDGDAPDP